MARPIARPGRKKNEIPACGNDGEGRRALLDGGGRVSNHSEENDMLEVKNDALETSFEALERQDEDVAELRAEVAQLKARLDSGPVARPALTEAKGQRSEFVESYLRKGIEAGVELKALTGTSDAAGGYAVPEEIDAEIDRLLTSISPIRAIANVVKVGTAGYRKLVTAGGTPSGWVSEVAARPETDTPTFVEIAPPFGELYANPAASQTMLDDAAFDVEAWLASEIATEFARAEGQAFVSGSGVNRPKGFLTSPVSADPDGTRAFGTLQFVPTGTAGAFPPGNQTDKLIDLVQALRPPYRQGAVFVMNSATASTIRKFKSSTGALLWQPSLTAGQPNTLLGYPVVEAEDMPDVAADSLSIAFGNFRAGYLIAERTETQILRDPFTHKPFVHFYATKRIGGQVSNSEAIKLMKFGA
jgi:HK97 family phage major capsid protein